MPITLPATLFIVGLIIGFAGFIYALVNGARGAKNFSRGVDQAFIAPDPERSNPLRLLQEVKNASWAAGKRHLVAMGIMAFGGLLSLIGMFIFIARLCSR